MRNLVIASTAFLFLAGCMTRISPGNVGIEVSLSGSQRGVRDYPIRTGRVWYNPWSTQIIEYPTFVQTAIWTKNPGEGHPSNEEITFTTKDSMVVSMDVNLSYSLLSNRVPEFYVKFRLDDIDKFTHGFLRNIARDCVNEVGGKYGVEQIMGDNAEFLNNARKCVAELVDPYGIKLESFGCIGAPRPPQQVIENINLKVQAAQIAIQKQNEVLQAEADAKKLVAESEGKARSAIAISKGDAEANRIVTDSLNDKLMKWFELNTNRFATGKWDGSLPKVTTGHGTGMILQLPEPGK